MIEAGECLRKAHECQKLASECNASLIGTRAAMLRTHFLQIAEGWSLLAQQCLMIGNSPHQARPN